MSFPWTSSPPQELERHLDGAVTRYSFFSPAPETLTTGAVPGCTIGFASVSSPNLRPPDLEAAANVPWDAPGGE